MQTQMKPTRSILSFFVILFILLIFAVPTLAQPTGNFIGDFFSGIISFFSNLFGGGPTGYQTAGTIEDDFNDNSFDTNIWNRTSSSTIIEQNQAINATSAGSPYQVLRSLATFSGAKEFGVIIKKTSAANSGWVKVTVTDSGIDFDKGNNGAQIFFDLDGKFGAHIKVNGQNTDYKFSNVAYSSNVYYWIIIKRNSDGKLIFRIEDSNHNLVAEKTTTQAISSSVALKFNPVEVAQYASSTQSFVDSAYVREYSGTTTTTQSNATTTTVTTQPNATTTTKPPNATTTTQPNATTTTTQPNVTTTTKPNATTTTVGVTTTVTTQPNVTTTTQKALSCSDTDGGNSIFVPGTATDQDGNSYVDACVNNSTLMEYYCSNNAIASQKANCQYGCNNGACKSYLENLIEQILELLNKILGILGGGGGTTTTTIAPTTTTKPPATTTTVNVTTTTKPPATTSTTALNVTTTATTQPNATTTTSAGLPDLSISASDVARTAYSCDKSKGSFGDGNFFVVIRNIGGSTSGNFNASFIAYNSTHRFELFISNSTTSLVASSNYAPPNLNYVYNISYLGEYPTSIRAGGFFNISGYFNTSNYPGLIVLYPGTSRSIGPAPSQKFNLNITVDNFNEVQESNENNNFVSISNINYVKC